MIQSEKLGGSLVEALKIYAAELRTRRRQRAQEQANKAAVKLLFPARPVHLPDHVHRDSGACRHAADRQHEGPPLSFRDRRGL
jgi:hypothetical protein